MNTTTGNGRTGKSVKQLLADVQAAATSKSKESPMVIANTIAAFAELQVKLSENESNISSRNIWIQKQLTKLTVVIMLLTIVQLALAFIQFHQQRNSRKNIPSSRADSEQR